MKYEKEFRRYFSKIPIFTFKDAKRYLCMMGASEAYVKLFVYGQMKRRSLLRVGKGVYSYLDNEIAVGFAFRPFYYGLEFSMTLHRLWTQISVPVIITTTKAVPGIRESMGKRILIRRISEHMFFGIEYIEYNGMFVPVSDIEKTLIDFAYFNIDLNGDDTRTVLQKCSVRRLMEYARASNRKVEKRIEDILSTHAL